MQFRNTRTGQEVSGDGFKFIARTPGAREGHAGWTTLKKAALVNSLVSEELSWAEWSRALDELAGGEMGTRLEGTALERIRYSLNINQTPAQAGVSVSEVGDRIIGAPDSHARRFAQGMP